MRLALVLCLAAAACRPETTRPSFPPVRGAPTAGIALPVPTATRLLGDLLRADSIPIRRLEPRDGFLESPWIDTLGWRSTTRRILGGRVVRVRAWVDPTRPGHSQITVETLYRPLADPSLPERELDEQVPPDHPAGKLVADILERLVKQYGDSAQN